MKKARRATAKAATRKTKTPVRRLALKTPAEALSADEVVHLETLVKSFEDSEKAWQRMTAPVDETDPWTKVEDHLLERRADDAERRWKFFSK